MTIEDETGVANLVIFKTLFDTYRKEILRSRLIMVEGKVQIEGDVIHVIVKHCYDFSKLLRHLTSGSREDSRLLTLARADETSIPAHAQRTKAKERHEELFPGARNFR